MTRSLRLCDRVGTNRTKFSSHFIGQHFFKAETKQMWRVAAVGPRHHVAAEPRRTARPPMTSGAAVGETGANSQSSFNRSVAVTSDRSLTLFTRKFPLKDLAAPTKGAERIPRNDVQGRIRRVDIASADTNLVSVCFVDSQVGVCEMVVHQLRRDRHCHEQCSDG